MVAEGAIVASLIAPAVVVAALSATPGDALAPRTGVGGDATNAIRRLVTSRSGSVIRRNREGA